MIKCKQCSLLCDSLGRYFIARNIYPRNHWHSWVETPNLIINWLLYRICAIARHRWLCLSQLVRNSRAIYLFLILSLVVAVSLITHQLKPNWSCNYTTILMWVFTRAYILYPLPKNGTQWKFRELNDIVDGGWQIRANTYVGTVCNNYKRWCL